MMNGIILLDVFLYTISKTGRFSWYLVRKPYHGKGYNVLAKETFFKEIFFELGIETVFMRIRKKTFDP